MAEDREQSLWSLAISESAKVLLALVNNVFDWRTVGVVSVTVCTAFCVETIYVAPEARVLTNLGETLGKAAASAVMSAIGYILALLLIAVFVPVLAMAHKRNKLQGAELARLKAERDPDRASSTNVLTLRPAQPEQTEQVRITAEFPGRAEQATSHETPSNEAPTQVRDNV